MICKKFGNFPSRVRAHYACARAGAYILDVLAPVDTEVYYVNKILMYQIWLFLGI